jgi:hypothetical protein
VKDLHGADQFYREVLGMRASVSGLECGFTKPVAAITTSRWLRLAHRPGRPSESTAD